MLAPVLLALGLALPPGGGAKAQIADNLLSHDDRAHYRKAYRAAKKRNWPGAHRLARRAKDPLPAKALRWLNYRESGNRASFNEITDFLTTNPAWPSRQRLIRRAEEAMEKSRVSDRAALDWFTLHRPLSGPGQIRLAEAMLANGMQEDGMQWLRYAWINNVFARRQSKKLYRRYRKTFTMADHIARLDHLLWQGHRYSARRLYTVVPKDYRKLAEARESLMVRGPGVDSKIRAVPANLLSDGGLNYERVRWRRRKNLDKTAREILLKPRPHLGPRPEKWWLERHIQARGALREGDAALAYRLAANHGQVPGRFSFAQAEWLAGWIALRFLNDGAQSLRHFAALYNNVRFPVSLARAAYWAGRANIALSRSIDATKWYRAAARYPSTYYGQLAIQALGPKAVWRMPREPSPRDAVMRKFNNREIVRLSRIFLELGQEEHLRPFILHLTRSAVDADGRLLAARLGQALGQPSLAVHAAKLSLRAGTLLPRTGYPILSKMPPMPVEAALAHAVARQESEFNPRAVSSASAMGLMQLLPRTARKVAKGLHLRYRQDRLFDGGYNMRLGAAYLGQLVKAYRGSYIMALAAYNAGPNRVSRWRRKNGDPRKDGVDPIDWVEAISISETRNYVQRVLENLQVYRWRLHPKGAKLTLLEDLHRNGTPSQ
ncbi:MAG: lytic transglycosylase domain-containing protein [Rhodospirillaceae bacterium]|nr:lytic transglycosylase domain-containing protein [Rhodospirillaceae bacterium]MBT3495387.1 lytic transglycosylase domain-containing protein [Rhodospirillaceae bacterium]MBT3778784.1 lytic transglycosylase domain-containing protein [Rhodospirillaceae bacterium]MBT3975570.1 lytic transglycosylase domain-containing protein [Rhodospirillaceae bacterium]MBT4170516.1 lytic transglycosylase domain-containing protein [Rhodospirillaceae bacterium]